MRFGSWRKSTRRVRGLKPRRPATRLACEALEEGRLLSVSDLLPAAALSSQVMAEPSDPLVLGMTGQTDYSAVAADAQGNHVAVWIVTLPDLPGDLFPTHHEAVVAQRYSAAGEALGGELTVIDQLDTSFSNVHIAMASDGRFVVGWSTLSFGPPPGGILILDSSVQRFAADGSKLGAS